MFLRKTPSRGAIPFAFVTLFRRPAIVLLLILLSGCSAINTAPAPLASAASNDSKYTLNILEEVNDGSRLYVTANIAVSEDLRNTQALVRLRAMANGSTVGEAFVPLTEQNRSQQNADLYQVKMSVDANEFTDYQLDLLWGSEATVYLGTLPQDEIIKVSNLHLAKGKKPTITGTFENRGVVPVTHLTALVQLVWVPEGGKLDLSELKAENDTEVEVPGLLIVPGATKDFSIELEIAIPAEKGGGYQPVVRIKNEPRAAGPTNTDSAPSDTDG